MTARDFAREMGERIEAATADGPYVPRVLATELADKLRANDPDLLTGWLDAQAAHFLWQAINDLDRSRRAHAQHSAARSAFAAAVDTSERTSDPGALTPFLSARYTVADGTRRELRLLDRADCTHVGADYAARARRNQLKAAFFTALADKIGDRRVGDVFTEGQLRVMFTSFDHEAA